jgi:hypothetical protein
VQWDKNHVDVISMTRADSACFSSVSLERMDETTKMTKEENKTILDRTIEAEDIDWLIRNDCFLVHC